MMSSPTEQVRPALRKSLGRSRPSIGALRLAGPVAALLAASLLAWFVIQTGALNLAAPQKSDKLPEVQHPDQVSGSNAAIAGYDRDQRPFQIRAAAGQQDKDVKSLVHLQKVVGSFERASGRKMDVTARLGRYDTASRKFELEGSVIFSEGNAMRAFMETAEINTADQSLRSTAPVVVDMRGANIRAGSLTVTENGTRVLFKGGVKARFVASSGAAGDGG